MAATRSELLTGAKLVRRYDQVTLPICGLTLWIQSLSERELSRYRLSMLDQTGTFDKGRARQSASLLLALCAVDESGSVLFTPADIEAIEEWDAADVTAAFNACRAHCGLLAEGVSTALGNSKPATD